MRRIRFKYLLFVPFYWLAINIRKILFKLGILRTVSFSIPIINVGNIQVGGTGKTPTIEYLVKLLSAKYKVAILSRGYKRNTKGFILASDRDNYTTIGDEPMQYFLKFKNIAVAVCEKRVDGVNNLLNLIPDLDIILLDDAYQHWYIKAGLNILITDYFNLFTKDFLLPAGNLREPISAYKRADIIVVTKTPNIYSPFIYKDLVEKIKPLDYQFFSMSYIKYGSPVRLYGTTNDNALRDINTILLVSGIGDPEPFKDYLKNFCSQLDTMIFPDHYSYTNNDYIKIKNTYRNIPSKRKVIVTTEKDSVRMNNFEAKSLLEKLPFYYIPIEFDFHDNFKSDFDKKILEYVENIKANSTKLQ